MQMPIVRFTGLWTKEEIEACQDSQLIKDITKDRSEMFDLWNSFQKVLGGYPDIF